LRAASCQKKEIEWGKRLEKYGRCAAVGVGKRARKSKKAVKRNERFVIVFLNEEREIKTLKGAYLDDVYKNQIVDAQGN
jgi:hypothetical protein